MTQQELLARALDFLDRTEIKGSEADDMALVRQWLRRLQHSALLASLEPRTGVAGSAPVLSPAPAGQVAGTVSK